MKFMMNGSEYDESELKAMKAAAPKSKPRSASTEEKFLGMRVAGFPPGFIETQRIAHEKAQQGAEFPAAFSVEQFLQTAKPKPVSHKMYQVRASADVCADLARRAGWEHVQVYQVTR
ncbi:hypothetical protein AXY46_03445 [Achromobacter xylosoxidans]|nr:hypothetical protein AXY46_03445 [Achromobacter xylosoxidans]